MSEFARRIRPHVESELREAGAARARGDAGEEFRRLERAHVLGQASTREHVRVHARMLAYGWRRRDWREVRGQLTRLVGAVTKTAIGWLPSGNTGGANVSAFQPMPVPDDLAAKLAEASREPRA